MEEGTVFKKAEETVWQCRNCGYIYVGTEAVSYTHLKGVRAKFEALYIVPKPVIAHVIVHEQLQHFVVIYKVEKKKEYILLRTTSTASAICDLSWLHQSHPSA